LELNIDKNKKIIWRITALWAFSEAALGGILHALKIPFTGLLIGGSATIFISLIAYFSESRNEIIKATLKVLLVKFVASPYSPLNAYFAVVVQSILGYLLFWKGFNKISPVILGVVSLLLSSVQKIFVLTIVFGVTLWESINIFFDFVMSKVLKLSSYSLGVEFSYIIIGAYILLHLLGGVFAGLFAAKIPATIEKSSADTSKNKEIQMAVNNHLIGKRKKRKKWWLRPSSILLFIFSVILIVLSFNYEELGSGLAKSIIIMWVRSVLIIVVWFYFISPVLIKIVKKYLAKKQKSHSKEIDNIINIFPNIRAVIRVSWNECSNKKGLRKGIKLMELVLINFLLLDIE
jgi:hypothetical protein